MIDKGADVMYAERFGVSDAAKEKGKLAIGNVINTQDKYPDTVVASALWNMEPTIDRALKAVKDGKFKAEDYGPYSMMKHKGSELAPLGTFEKKVPADLVDKVKAKEKAILDGKFKVKVDDAEPKSTPSDARPPARSAAASRTSCRSPLRRSCALAGITKRFGALVANDAISLELARGEVLALLGENGAGKSTLVSILFGHYVADAGTIEVVRPAAAAGRSGGGARRRHRHGAPALHAGRQPDACSTT